MNEHLTDKIPTFEMKIVNDSKRITWITSTKILVNIIYEKQEDGNNFWKYCSRTKYHRVN